MTVTLVKPGIGSTGWGDDVNGNFTKIENAFNGVTAISPELELTDNLKIATGKYVGLDGGGRIEFDDQATDEVNFLDCNVGVGTSSPTKKVDIEGDILRIRGTGDINHARGIMLWGPDFETWWGLYGANKGEGNSLRGGDAVEGALFAAHAIRFRVPSTTDVGFIFEDVGTGSPYTEGLLASIRGGDGLAYFKGDTCIGTKPEENGAIVYADIRLYATGAAVFNENGNDADFRIEGDSIENLFCVNAGDDRVGIGTSSPGDLLTLYGTASSVAGPHIRAMVSGSTDPVLQILNYAHDNISINFDAYFDGNWKSSHQSSNFSIYKLDDKLQFWYASGTAAGQQNDWNQDGIVLDTSGNVGVGTNSPSERLHVDGNLKISDGGNLVLDTTTGTKIGTSASQKIGFFNATPVTQQAHIADADGTIEDITSKFNTLLSELEALGLLASS